jgi:hypothetical protein
LLDFGAETPQKLAEKLQMNRQAILQEIKMDVSLLETTK